MKKDHNFARDVFDFQKKFEYDFSSSISKMTNCLENMACILGLQQLKKHDFNIPENYMQVSNELIRNGIGMSSNSVSNRIMGAAVHNQRRLDATKERLRNKLEARKTSNKN